MPSKSLLLFAFALPLIHSLPQSPILNELQSWGVVPTAATPTATLYLEDFFRQPADLPDRFPIVRNQRLGLSFPNVSAQFEDLFYAQSVGNLREAAPSLRWIQLTDGYTFFPKNGDLDTLRDELQWLRAHLHRVARLLHSQSFELDDQSSFRVTVFLNSTQIDSATLRRAIHDDFGFGDHKVGDCGVDLEFERSGVPVRLAVRFADRLSPMMREDLPRGRERHSVADAAILKARVAERMFGAMFGGFLPRLFECTV